MDYALCEAPGILWEEGVEVLSSLVDSFLCTDSQTLQDIGEVLRISSKELSFYDMCCTTL